MKTQEQRERARQLTTCAEHILLESTCTIGHSLRLLRKHLSDTEVINIYQWDGPRFYIEVRDTRDGWGAVENMRIWFTVDVKADKIIWNHQGGNCGVRTNKWKAYVNFHCGQNRENVHWYRSVYLKRGTS